MTFNVLATLITSAEIFATRTSTAWTSAIASVSGCLSWPGQATASASRLRVSQPAAWMVSVTSTRGLMVCVLPFSQSRALLLDDTQALEDFSKFQNIVDIFTLREPLAHLFLLRR